MTKTWVEYAVVGVASFVGSALLTILWVFMLTGFGGLIFLYENVSASNLTWLGIGFVLAYATVRTIREKVSQ